MRGVHQKKMSLDNLIQHHAFDTVQSPGKECSVKLSHQNIFSIKCSFINIFWGKQLHLGRNIWNKEPNKYPMDQTQRKLLHKLQCLKQLNARQAVFSLFRVKYQRYQNMRICLDCSEMINHKKLKPSCHSSTMPTFVQSSSEEILMLETKNLALKLGNLLPIG